MPATNSPPGLTQEQVTTLFNQLWAENVGVFANNIDAVEAQNLIDASLAPVVSAIPAPAASAPPSVQDTSVQGTVTRYAMENHTHASKTRRQRLTQPSASSTYVWTYPTPFAAGVSPAVCAIVQVASGTTDLFNVQVVGNPTNTQCTFQINRVSAGLLSLLLGALSINPTPVVSTLHMFALEP